MAGVHSFTYATNIKFPGYTGYIRHMSRKVSLEEVVFEIGFETCVGLSQKKMGQNGYSNRRISTEILVA